MPSLKFSTCTNPTAMRHQIYENGRGGLICPPYGTVPHNCNRLRHQIVQTICRVLARYRVLIQSTPEPQCMKHLFNNLTGDICLP